MWLLLLAGAALLYYLKPKETATVLQLIPAKLQGLGVTPNWPKQSIAAFQTGKHYFFALPIQDDMSAPRRLDSFVIALTLMGFKDVKAFPKVGGETIDQLYTKADSPYPSDWSTFNGVRCSGTWAGSSGQTFNFDLTKPFGGTQATVWMSTEDFSAMHTMANR